MRYVDNEEGESFARAWVAAGVAGVVALAVIVGAIVAGTIEPQPFNGHAPTGYYLLKDPPQWQPGHEPPAAQAGGAPVERTAVLSVGSAANVAVAYTGMRHLIARCLNQTTGVPLYVVESSATGTTTGLGPFCDTCMGGARLPPLGAAHLRTSSGTAAVSCGFVESWPSGAALGDGGLGLSLGTADARYLMLDTSNNPVTGCITINNAGNPNATVCEDGLDRSSATAATFNLQNSGAGALILQRDANLVWDEGNDGPGSTLNADFLDGVSSSGFAQVTTQTATCVDDGAGTPASLTLAPTCAAGNAYVAVKLVNADADGCTVTLAETTAQLGCFALLFLSSSAGGAVTAADVSNIAEFDGSWIPGVGDNVALIYEDLANDRWSEWTRSTTGSKITTLGLAGISGGNDLNFYDATGAIDAFLRTTSGGTSQLLLMANGAVPTGIKAQSQQMWWGTSGARGPFEAVGNAAESIASGDGNEASVYTWGGQGASWPQQTSTQTLANPTDTATAPKSDSCRVTSAAATAWTPAETDGGNAVPEGFFSCCTNVGANAVTMTASAGVYEAPGAATILEQWEAVCMTYVSTRWVELRPASADAYRAEGNGSEAAYGVGTGTTGLDGDADTVWLMAGGSTLFDCDATSARCTVTQSFDPGADNAIDFGSATKGWRNTWLANDTSGVAGSYEVPGRAVGPGVAAQSMPTCGTSIGGAKIFMDDTDDSKPAAHCECTSNASDVYGWVGYSYVSGAPVPASCPP